jgi:excisionase family DNA binding protein
MSDELLKVEEVARILKVGRTMIYALLAAGELLPVKIGRCLRIPRSAVDALIARKLKEGDDA